MMRWGWPVAIAILAWACGSEITTPPGVGLTVDNPTASTGDTIIVRLTNGSDAPLEYNLCAADLQLESSGGWTSVQKLPAGAACVATLETLAPGQTGLAYQVVYDFIAVGTYRVNALVYWQGDAFDLISNSFVIQS
jgi:hypothetical protein